MTTENDEETSDPLLAPINSDDEEASDDGSLTPVTKSKISRRPPGYKMGSYTETVKGDGEWHVLTGGKPLPDWSGLDQTADRSEVPSFAPTQWRGAGYKARLKCYEKMSEPLATKFKEGMDTKIFIDEVKEHNEKYGLNTWHYLPDPTDPSRMANVVEEYPLFTYQVDKSVAEAATFAELNYDEFDQENTMAAASFVLESLSADLKIGITIMMAPGERNIFTCVWIRLMGRLNQMGTRYNTIRYRYKKR